MSLTEENSTHSGIWRASNVLSWLSLCRNIGSYRSLGCRSAQPLHAIGKIGWLGSLKKNIFTTSEYCTKLLYKVPSSLQLYQLLRFTTLIILNLHAQPIFADVNSSNNNIRQWPGRFSSCSPTQHLSSYAGAIFHRERQSGIGSRSKKPPVKEKSRFSACNCTQYVTNGGF